MIARDTRFFSAAGPDSRGGRGVGQKDCPAGRVWAAAGSAFAEEPESVMEPPVPAPVFWFSSPRSSPDRPANAMGCYPTFPQNAGTVLTAKPVADRAVSARSLQLPDKFFSSPVRNGRFGSWPIGLPQPGRPARRTAYLQPQALPPQAVEISLMAFSTAVRVSPVRF